MRHQGFCDANNQPISGAVTATVVSIDPSQPESMALLPADAEAGLGKSSATTRVTVASGYVGAIIQQPILGNDVGQYGIFACCADVNGDGNITMQLGIPRTLANNPATGQPWRIGETVPAYRQDPATGRWIREGAFSVVVTGATQEAVLRLSMRNLQSGYWQGAVDVQTTNITLNINRNGQTGPLTAMLSQTGLRRCATSRRP